jgi:hypothetical protein
MITYPAFNSIEMHSFVNRILNFEYHPQALFLMWKFVRWGWHPVQMKNLRKYPHNSFPVRPNML